MPACICLNLALATALTIVGTTSFLQAQTPQRISGEWRPNYPSTPLQTIGKGLFKVKLLGRNPSLNQLENLRVSIADNKGKPITDARIAVSGQALDVERGLPTIPHVSRSKAAGIYVVEGVRFNMPGAWVLIFEITSGAIRDRTMLKVSIPG